MGLNFKKITNVPVVDSVGEGDTLLLNVGGVAKQIPANKFSTSGGGGGGGLVYGLDLTDNAEGFMAYADEGLTQPLTYEEGKALLLGGAKLAYKMPVGEDVYGDGRVAPLTVVAVDLMKICAIGIYLYGYAETQVIFSDTGAE